MADWIDVVGRVGIGKEFGQIQDDYFLALGRMVHHFAQVEGQLQLLLWLEAQTTTAIAKAIFSGVKSDSARDFINRITDAKGGKRSAVLSRAFEQMGIVTKARNDILHFGTDFRMENAPEFVVTNERQAHVPEKLRPTVVSASILNDITYDLHTIRAAITCRMLEIARVGGQLAAKEVSAPWIEAAQRPWRYIPRRPSAPRRKRPQTPPTPPPPLDASQA